MASRIFNFILLGMMILLILVDIASFIYMMTYMCGSIEPEISQECGYIIAANSINIFYNCFILMAIISILVSITNYNKYHSKRLSRCPNIFALTMILPIVILAGSLFIYSLLLPCVFGITEINDKLIPCNIPIAATGIFFIYYLIMLIINIKAIHIIHKNKTDAEYSLLELKT